MEKKNGVSGLLIIVVFAVVCFLVYYVMVATKSKVDDANDTQTLNNDTYDYNAGNIVDDDSIKSEIITIMEKYYTTVDFSIKCGKKDFDDVYYPNGDNVYPDYVRCLEYDSIEDLKRYYNSFLSENFYSNIIELSFIEHDNKLYCLAHHTAPYTYENNSFNIDTVRKNDDFFNVVGVYKTEENGLYPEYTFDVKMKFVYSNNHLVLDKYEDEMRMQ